MGLTYTVKALADAGSDKASYVQFTTDNSYVAGGYTLASSDFKQLAEYGAITSSSSVVLLLSEKSVNGYRVALDKTNGNPERGCREEDKR